MVIEDRASLIKLAQAVMDDNTMGALDLANEVMEEEKKRKALHPFPDFGDLIPMVEFKRAVEGLAFMDYDGHGYLAMKDGESNILVIPSFLDEITELYPEFTHVFWYNK